MKDARKTEYLATIERDGEKIQVPARWNPSKTLRDRPRLNSDARRAPKRASWAWAHDEATAASFTDDERAVFIALGVFPEQARETYLK